MNHVTNKHFALQLEFCNATERQLDGKGCAQKGEIDKFLRDNAVSVNILRRKPDLLSYDTEIIEESVDYVYYSSKPSSQSVRSTEIWVHQNKIITEDNLLGVVNSEKVTEFIDLS